MSRRRPVAALLLLLAALLGGGCSALRTEGETGFNLANLAQSDIDRVAELSQRLLLADLRRLMRRLYRQNPEQWRRADQPSPEAGVRRIFGATLRWNLPEFGDARGNDILLLAFDPAYRGDRVAALTAGLVSMTMRAYGRTTEIYLTHALDPQKHHNCARNFEATAWLLAHRRRANGAPWLRADDAATAPDSASQVGFERLFGKMIANQDLLATVLADRLNRRIANTVRSVTTGIFLPI